MRKSFPYALIAVTCAILAGCNQCSNSKESTPSAAETQAVNTTAAANTQAATTTAQDAAKPADATAATGAETLQITDIKEGTGLTATAGKKVTVNYTGTLLNGTKFDSTKDRGTPFSFVLGSGMVIAGWDQGVKGMKEGGVRKLVIPPNLAYGNRSVGGVIPPNSTLVFEIELLKVE